MHQTDKFIRALEELAASYAEVDYQQRGYHVEVMLTGDQLRRFAKLMYELEYYLVFVSAVHAAPALEGRYQFAHFDVRSRILARVPVGDDGSLPTISDIFQGANWHERETRDFFGIVYRDHPYLEPLILPETSVDLKPLLKDEQQLKNLEEICWPPAAEEEGETSADQEKS
ncbi:MAG: NADH-quinone oxidoreductase subunit C [Deltaproteobacteria bacterium]|nr:NADH-quinone oxidoreductase subunit C [Deltaproteobacteria bacterium]